MPWIEPWFRYFTGALEIIAALLLVAGRRLPGGALSLMILLGAIGAHLTLLGILTPMSSDPGAAKSSMLFIVALGALSVSAVVTFLAMRNAKLR